MAGSLLILMEYATCFKYAYGGILKALLESSKAFSLNEDGVSNRQKVGNHHVVTHRLF